MKEATIYGASEPSSVTRGLLLKSAPLLHEWSRSFCAQKKSSGMEEWAKTERETRVEDVLSCDWYHGTWQFLRLLNMVAVPPWYAFYQEALSAALRAKRSSRVLIAACADYGMLATLHSAIVAAEASPSIVVVDICETPLRACRWYAGQFGLQLECLRGDLLTSSSLEGEAFDLIVTDEFLTVIKNDDKPVISARWRNLLRPGGLLVTTAMIGGRTTPELRARYSERARGLWTENLDMVSALGIDASELIRCSTRFADLHNRYMLSDEEELKSLLRGFDYSITPIVTPGECVNPTSSFQIVARAVAAG
jgi:hypothetical protein